MGNFFAIVSAPAYQNIQIDTAAAPEQTLAISYEATEIMINPPAPASLFAAIPKIGEGTLQTVREDIGDCVRCKLHKGRTKIVFGDGHPQAKLLFIGEGPGRDEDLQGLPFVGRAGQTPDADD